MYNPVAYQTVGFFFVKQIGRYLREMLGEWVRLTARNCIYGMHYIVSQKLDRIYDFYFFISIIM